MKSKIYNIINNKIEESKKVSTADPDLSKRLSEEAYKLSKENGLRLKEGYSLISMAFASRAKSQTKEMMDLSFKALNIFESEKDILGRIKAMNLVGIAYFYNSMYEESLRYLIEVSKLLNIEKDDFMLSCVLNNIGEIYRESENYDSALDYYNKAVDISKSNKFERINASILGNIGEVYYSKEMFEKSLKVLNDSYKILIKGNDMVSLGETENRIGKVHCKMGNYNKASNFFNSALNRLENIENKYYMIDVYINIGKMKQNSEPKKALSFYKKSLDYSKKVNAKKKTCEIYEMISELYEVLGEYKLSLDYFRNHSNINKEIMASHLGDKLEILNIELDNTKESNKYIELKKRLEKEIEYQKKEIKKIKKTNKTLFQKAYEDELTGVPNRRSINSYLRKVLSDKATKNQTLGVLMIDIDHFKMYNDYWGHPRGDLCLKEIASGINKIQESSKNIFGRYGGEEFVYILRDKDELNVEEMGNNIREAVERLNLYYILNSEKKYLTVSVGGVYGKISDFDKFSNLMKLADKELYEAKDQGRNKTIVKHLTEIN